jgi:hypothetical protein
MALPTIKDFNFYDNYLFTALDFTTFQSYTAQQYAAATQAGSGAVLTGLDVTGSSASMNVTVASGFAMSASGDLMGSASSNVITLTSDPSNSKKSLIVLRPAATGVDYIPDPRNPLGPQIPLHNVMGSTVVLLDGTASATPTYPATSATDVILIGLTIPAAATGLPYSDFDRSVRSISFTQQKIESSYSEPYLLKNIGLSVSSASGLASSGTGAMTVTMTDASGNQLSPASHAIIAFGSANNPSSSYVKRMITSSPTVTIPASKAMAMTTDPNELIYVWAIDNNGTVELALSGAWFGTSSGVVSTSNFSGLGNIGSQPGNAAAVAFDTLYSTTARTNVYARLIGVIDLVYSNSTGPVWSINAIKVAGVYPQDLQAEAGTFSLTMTGPFNVNQPMTVQYSRRGANVSLYIPTVQATHAGTSQSVSDAVSNPPSRLCLTEPTGTVNGSVGVVSGQVNNGSRSDTAIMNVISGANGFAISAASAWGTSGNNGWWQFTVSFRNGSSHL